MDLQKLDFLIYLSRHWGFTIEWCNALACFYPGIHAHSLTRWPLNILQKAWTGCVVPEGYLRIHADLNCCSVCGKSRTTKPRPIRHNRSSSASLEASLSRFAITLQAVGEMSIPIHWRFNLCAETSAVPQPQNASSTTSFSFVLVTMIRSRSASGFWVG